MHFMIHFEDGEIAIGKPLGSMDTGWNDLPEKPISKLAYMNPYGDLLVLQGYEEYNHMVECLQNMGQRPFIHEVYLMGAKGGKVVVYRIRVFQKSAEDPIQVGDITVRVTERGKEYLDSETWGWRKGSNVGAGSTPAQIGQSA